MRGARGFTYVELVVALGLFSMVMGAMAAVYATALQNETRTITASTLGNNATLLGRALQRSIASASFVQVPPANTASITSPAAGATLVSWDNTDPLDGSVLDPNAGGRTFRQLCVRVNRGATPQQDRDVLYRYELANAPWPVAPVAAANCGASGPGGAPILIAGGVLGMRIDATFNRIDNNDLQLSYAVNYSPGGGLPPLNPVSEATQITLTGSLQSP